MRTPNTKCCICEKPLYRRPSELSKVRYVACMGHRAEAARQHELTEAQMAALSKGRKPGTNNRTGYKHREETKRKISNAQKKWCDENPEKVKARGEKTRGPKHYNWSGGCSRLNTAIRRMTENRNWMERVKRRDGKYLRCGGCEKLEAHHITPLSELIDTYGIKSTQEAREFANILWDDNNGETLCQRCHYEEHGRNYAN